LNRKIIIDSNILFSALLNLDSKIGQILLIGDKYFDFYAPGYIREEIFEYKDKIMKHSRMNEIEFIETYELLMHGIRVMNSKLIPPEFYSKALNLCKDVDVDDTIFVALSEYLRARLWTGDKKLKNGLKQKGYFRIIATEELFKEFLEKESNR
jgi:predicted nucleic acid-binding protein